jgi:hypothetical protein
MITVDTGATWTTWATATTSSATTWVDWTGNTITSTTPDLYRIWCDETTATTSSIATDTWGTWVTIDQQRIISEPRVVNEIRLADIKRQKERNVIKANATRLLRYALTRKQKKDFDKHNHFFVRGGNSGNLYKIKHGRAGNVLLLDKNKQVKESLCVHPHIYCPDEDTMLAQKIMIEHMEEQFRNTANITYH